MFGRVGPPFWDDKRVFLVGGGPSLRGFDFRRFSGVPEHVVCGVNQAMLDIPDCAAGVSMDWNFVRENHARLAVFAVRAQLYLAIGNRWPEGMAEIPGAIYLHNFEGEGISFDPAYVYRGGTSGYTALNVAVLKRAKTIILFGYDYGAIDGVNHYHNAYPWFHKASEQSWPTWAMHYDHAAWPLRRGGILVINASLNSAITVFPRCEIERAFTTHLTLAST